MGLESRGSRLYYYTKKWVNGRCVSRYEGGGLIADLAHRLDGIERDKAHYARWKDALDADEERKHLEAADATIAALDARASALFRAVMVAAGYHLHKRGQWRRSMSKTKTLAKKAKVEAPPAKRDPSVPLTEPEMAVIFARAIEGEEAVRSDLLLAIAQKGEAWAKRAGSSEWYAEDAMVRAFADKDMLLYEVLRKRINALTRELAGEDGTVIEWLLARRIAMCWFAVHAAEHNVCTGTGSLKVQAARGHHADQCHKRFLSAVKTLATVRRLALPQILAIVNQAAPTPQAEALDVTPANSLGTPE